MIQKAKLTELPANSELQARIKPGDFLDCYEVPSDMKVREAAEIITSFPPWVKGLMLLRKAATMPFGLANDASGDGNNIGIFPVESESDTELVAGFNDKHLEFRVSVLSQEGKVYLATWVHTHNLGGQLYLAGIMPFHILISKNALNRLLLVDRSE